jgi:hypothetical protein
MAIRGAIAAAGRTPHVLRTNRTPGAMSRNIFRGNELRGAAPIGNGLPLEPCSDRPRPAARTEHQPWRGRDKRFLDLAPGES